MKSRITIEFDAEDNNNPFLQILFQDSDDVRDKLLQNFLQRFGHVSSWCQIKWHPQQPEGSGIQRIRITPIQPEALVYHSRIMSEQQELDTSYREHIKNFQSTVKAPDTQIAK